jgi:ribosomal protein S7
MIKSLKNNKILGLKTKIISTLMVRGKKKTGEKILLKFAKLQQKSTSKSLKSIVHLAIINSTPTFKLNEQISKKGKRKAIKSIPSFIKNDSLRVMTSLKFIKNAVTKNKSSASFYQSLAAEIMASSTLKSQAIEQKNELQKQILVNKRYLSKFRW